MVDINCSIIGHLFYKIFQMIFLFLAVTGDRWDLSFGVNLGFRLIH